MALITLRDANITQSKPGIPIPISEQKSRVPQYRRYFVGEMLRIGTSRFYQTELLVTDEDGKLLRVAFAFPDDGKESGSVPTRYMKHGCAILILYATRVDMPGGGQGIEVHNPRHIKLLNFTLSDFEWFIDMLHDARSVEMRKRLCYGCGTRRYGLQRCPRCKLVYFCGPECQAHSTYKRGHKQDCMVLRDPDMTALFLQQWEQLTEFRCVSLRAWPAVLR